VAGLPSTSRFWEVIDKHKVNTFYTAPTAIRALMQSGDAPVKKTSRASLRLLGTVGEPINPEAWEWYHRVVGDGRCPIVDTWWQTETGGILITPLPGATRLKPGSATRAAALAAIAGASFATPRAALAHGQTVTMGGSYMAGTIVVRTRERHLYYVLGGGQAIRYSVGVGRAGMQWSGTSFISGKYIRPAWQAPASIRRDYQSGAAVVPGRLAVQSDGRRGDDAFGHRIRYSRHQRAGNDPRLRLPRLHPHVQRGHYRPFPSGRHRTVTTFCDGPVLTAIATLPLCRRALAEDSWGAAYLLTEA
jgi:acyl-CoA synthetase (AMP-forming)/AMP-acid ligase II